MPTWCANSSIKHYFSCLISHQSVCFASCSIPLKDKTPAIVPGVYDKAKIPGDDLLSHTVARAVPSAREGLTAGFGMGPGVSPPLMSPGKTNRIQLSTNRAQGTAKRTLTTA